MSCRDHACAVRSQKYSKDNTRKNYPARSVSSGIAPGAFKPKKLRARCGVVEGVYLESRIV